jgi:methylmalonyl-CoA/ethylmalonyl-CoA epimerase
MPAPVFSGINHLCVVTRDVDRLVRVWADKYGVGPWRVYTYATSNIEASVDGAPVEFGIRVGLCHLDPTTRIEIIQPLDDRSPYAQSLAERGDADHLHHVRLDVADYDVALGRLEGMGLDTIMSGRFEGGEPGTSSRATYLGTQEDVGFIVEVADLVPGSFVMPEPDYVHPAEP